MQVTLAQDTGPATILVDGIDLFGMEFPSIAGQPACRLYPPTIPSVDALLERLRERIA